MNLRKIRKQIHYHAAQRWAIMVVLSLIVGTIIIGRMHTWKHISETYNYTEHSNILQSLNEKVDKPKPTNKTKKNGIRPFKFDPNSVTTEALIEMGVKESIAKSWTKYTSKGGTFHETEDLKKLYAMNDYLYEKLAPYVDIKPKIYRQRSKYKKHKSKKSTSYELKKQDNYERKKVIPRDTMTLSEKKEYTTNFKNQRKIKSSGLKEAYKISLNKTDSLELQILDGIGPVLSSRIIKYRDKLGGFHNMNQLLEVYGIKPKLVTKIRDRITFNGSLRRIKINQISVDSLVKHPYFDYPTANIFVNYRNHHGPYRDIRDVRKIIAIKEYWLEEVAPYFDFSNH